MDAITILLSITFGLMFGWASAYQQHPLEKPPILRNGIIGIFSAMVSLILVILLTVNHGFFWAGLSAMFIIAISAFIINFKVQYNINKEYLGRNK